MNKADRELRKRMIFIRNLLKESGAKLYGYDPGVSFYVMDGKEYPRLPADRPIDWDRPPKSQKQVDRWSCAYVDGLAWKWLEPLLVELRALRKKVKA